MTGGNDERIDSSTRRTFLKAGSATLAVSGLAATGLGSVTAGDGDDLFVEDEAMEGLMFEGDFIPGGLFTIASPVIDFEPDVEDIEDEIFGGFNTRAIRYIRPVTRNVPLFPENDAPIGPYEEEFGFVVDDDFVGDEDEGLVIDGEPIENDGLTDEELRQLRPTIFTLEREVTPLFGEETMVNVLFSPVPDEEEDALYDELEEEIWGGPNPFRPGGDGPFGANVTGNATGNQSDFL